MSEPFPTFLAVIHAETPEQCALNSGRARDNGADGVFLINHVIDPPALVECYAAVRAAHPDWWVGLSFMGHGPAEALARLPADASGLWVSDAGVGEDGALSVQARDFVDARATSGWTGLYFGGVAFKHQRPVNDVAAAARAAALHVDAVTTSGAATGVAAPLEKLQLMKAAIGARPLAVASGVTVENAELYLGVVDCFLVATGISDSESELNPQRIAALAAKLKAGR